MNIDRVLQSLAKNEVDYLLIGGVNFLLRHAPEITYTSMFGLPITRKIWSAPLLF